MNDRVLGMIALGIKAGKVVSGKYQVAQMLELGKVKLIIFAEDAAKNTTESLKTKARKEKIEVITYGTSQVFEHILGKKDKKVIGITDENFSKAIIEKYETSGTSNQVTKK